MFYRKHNRVIKDTGTELLTKQSHKLECDINNILSQYKRTGIITHVQNARPTYGDLPDDVDFQNALEIMDSAYTAFNGLPSVIRDFYANDPQRFLSALNDPDHRERLTEWGVLKAPRPPDPGVPSQPPATPQAPSTGP